MPKPKPDTVGDGPPVTFKKSGKTIWASKDLTDKAQYASVIIANVKGNRLFYERG